MSEKTKGWAGAVFIGLLWGTPWIIGIPLLKVMPPDVLIWLRDTVAFLTLGGILKLGAKTGSIVPKTAFHISWSNRRDIAATIACGLIGQGFFGYFSYLSLNYISATENGIIQGLIPIVILLTGVFFYNARISVLQVISSATAFAGAGILIYEHSAAASGANLGSLICFVSVACFACTAHARAKLAAKYGAIATMFHQYATVCIGFGIFLLLQGADFSNVFQAFTSPERLASTLMLGTVISGTSYLIYLWAIERVGVEGTGMALNLMPLSSFVLAVIALHEPITARHILASALVVGSLVVFAKTGVKPKTAVSYEH